MINEGNSMISNIKLENKAYRHRGDLEEIYLVPGIRRIGEQCFDKCENLRSVNIPDTVVAIKKGAFADCRSLEDIVLSENLRKIEESTFENCFNLKQITIPESVTHIGKNAFLNCKSLKKVVLKGIKTRINPSSFEGCLNLEFEVAVEIAEHFEKPLDMIIRKGMKGLAGRLRTFEERCFVFDEILCSSIESVLESFKFKEVERQKEICILSAADAYVEGQSIEALKWENNQKLYWNGIEYERNSSEYQNLLDRLFQTVFEQDAQFRLDVAFLKNAAVQSNLGGFLPEKNVITKDEFIERRWKYCGNLSRKTR